MTAIMEWFSANWIVALRALILLAAGFPVARVLGAMAHRMALRRLSAQSAMLISKSVLYGLSAVVLLMFVSELGFNLTPILGAAGIAGVAVGFAAQTSLSNLISGLFLIAEKPFQVGDVLQVGDITGAVHAIDLLSVKLRTFDNRFVRIPNETLVKGQFTNVTRFPIRRLDIDIGVAHKEDVDRVVRVLADIADKNPYCLDEPEPVILFKGFGDSALQFLFAVWFEKSEMLKLRNSIMKQIKQRFDEEGIEIPFPHRSLYAGSKTEPFPIRIVHENGHVPASAGQDEVTRGKP